MRTTLCLAVLILCAGPLAAQDSGSVTGALQGLARQAAPLPASPEQIVRQGVDRLLGFLVGAGHPTPRSIRIFLDHEIAPHFDFGYMARWTAGPLHRRLSEAQRTRFASKLKSVFLGALARNLGSYSRPLPRVAVFAARSAGDTRRANVRARVTPDSGFRVNLDFRFYWAGDSWKIYDVAANGASALAFYRRYFGSRLRRYGPDSVLR